VKIGIVIAAGGSSNRMKKYNNKLLVKILGVEVIIRTINAFINIEEINEIIVVCKKSEIEKFDILIKKYFKSKVYLISGGETRQQSVFKGIKELDKQTDIVLIHDGARPLIKSDIIKKCISQTIEKKACSVGVKSKDTIKVIDENNIIIDTLNRDALINIQTPQCFLYEIAYKMHENALKNNINATDDCYLAEQLKYKVHIIFGDYDNIKITTEEDLEFLKHILINSQNT